MRNRAIAVLSAIPALICGIVVAASPAQAAAAPTPARSSTCPSTFFVGVRGAGERPADDGGFGQTVDDARASFISDVTDTLPDVQAKAIDYPAIAFPGKLLSFPKGDYPARYNASVARGVTALTGFLTRRYARCGSSTRFVLAGYDEGAQVAADTYQSALPSGVRAQLAGMALFGDARFNGSDAGPDEGTYSPAENGIASTLSSPRAVFGAAAYQVASYCIAGDPICNFKGNNARACITSPTTCPRLHYIDSDDPATDASYVESAGTFLAQRAIAASTGGKIKVGNPTSVFIYGDNDGRSIGTGDSISNLTGFLDAAGYSVVGAVRATDDALPPVVPAVGQIWFVGAYFGIPVDDQRRLEDFVRAGGGVFLTGERPCCEALNASDASVIHALIPDSDGVVVGGQGDQGSTGTINAGAPGGLATTPFTLSTWTPSACGGMAGVDPANVLFTAPNGTAIGAAWPQPNNNGHLVILMDVNWLESGYGDMVTAPKITQNIALYLSGQATPPAIARAAPHGAARASGAPSRTAHA